MEQNLFISVNKKKFNSNRSQVVISSPQAKEHFINNSQINYDNKLINDMETNNMNNNKKKMKKKKKIIMKIIKMKRMKHVKK